MRKFISLLLLMGLVSSLHLAFRDVQSPAAQLRYRYLHDMQDFQAEAERFQIALADENQEEIEQRFKRLRQAFKRLEFMLDYLQAQDVKDHVNGAPLLKTERNAPRLVVLQPKGLQRMEELVFEVPLNRPALQKLTKDMNYQIHMMLRFAEKIAFTDRQVFEALRLGLVRVMSLGITGFDTPASDQALKESAHSWESMLHYLEPYLSLSPSQAKADGIRYKFEQGLLQLRSSDFDSFDRARFLRSIIEPLYEELLRLHQSLQYETVDEVFQGALPWNYDSPSIFSDAFFNVDYYTGLDLTSESYQAQKELGRLLFFDPVLSGDLSASCASCHQPEKAFSDGLSKSRAKGGGFVSRNAPGLYNTLYSEKFFHDLRADRMETQMEHVIFSVKEFDTDYRTIFGRLEQSEGYQERFKKAFPERKGAINRYTLSQAIVAFLSELKSFDSEVDRYLRGEDVALSQPELRGLNLFMGKAACATCHFAPSFSGLVPPWFEENESEVLGVLTGPLELELDADPGRKAGGVVSDEADFYDKSFKTPTVRNVALTAPYFHNGAYLSLAEVLDFYNHGGAVGLGLALENQTLPGDSLHLDARELLDLEAFMRALTDTSSQIVAPTVLPDIEGIEP